MHYTTNTQGVKEQHPINLATKFVGYLGCDNKYFDRTCPSCKGMYSSYETVTCPKCGAQLTFITSGKGIKMSISEGTIYPAISTKQRDRDAGVTKSQKNGMEPKYRFKLFSFAGDDGALGPHPAHSFCTKGSMVELLVMNHQPIFKWFMGKDENGQDVPKLEVMYLIYDNYGDKVTHLKGPKQERAATTVLVNPDGTNASMVPADSQIAAVGGDVAGVLSAMKAQIEQMAAQIGNMPAPQAQPAPTSQLFPALQQTPQPQPTPQPQSGGVDPFDPFDGAL
jgi:hypothetical protein